MVRHDDDGICAKRCLAASPGFAIDLRVEHLHGQIEFLLQLQRPLLADGRGADHQQTALAFRPELAEHDSRLDPLPEANLVGQDDALGEGRLQGKERRLDLMRVEVDGRVEQRHRQTVHSAGGTTREVMGEVLGMVRGEG